MNFDHLPQVVFTNHDLLSLLHGTCLNDSVITGSVEWLMHKSEMTKNKIFLCNVISSELVLVHGLLKNPKNGMDLVQQMT